MKILLVGLSCFTFGYFVGAITEMRRAVKFIRKAADREQLILDLRKQVEQQRQAGQEGRN